MNAFSTILPVFDDSAQKLAWKSSALLAAGMGLFGTTTLTAGQSVSGKFWAIHALGGDVVLDTVTLASGDSGWSGKTLMGGDREFGQIIFVKVTSGTLVLTKAGL